MVKMRAASFKLFYSMNIFQHFFQGISRDSLPCIFNDSLKRLFCVFCMDRSSHRRCSVKKGVLRNFAKFTGKHLCQSLFFNKVPVNFAKFLRTPSTEHLQTTAFVWSMIKAIPAAGLPSMQLGSRTLGEIKCHSFWELFLKCHLQRVRSKRQANHYCSKLTLQ